jgi:hypothetical protein
MTDKVMLAFTGTQRGMTKAQMETLHAELAMWADDFELTGVHGVCIGADEQFNDLVRSLGGETWGFPGHDRHGKSPFRSNCTVDRLEKSRPYLERNKMIVNRGMFLLAAPRQDGEQLRSGTWSTVRFAQRKGVEVQLFLPDGRIEWLEMSDAS